jgi:2,3-bisphosphoglycerate-dependent phosphoglycerate mutase
MTHGTLIIARHHESEYNKLGLWTGTRDVHLTPHGKEKSFEMGLALKGAHIDQAFCSAQVRSLETLTEMLCAMGQEDAPIEHAAALNERDYGDYTGKSKWEMEKVLGEGVFDRVRREWDCPIPNGETLKEVYERVVPFYRARIVPLLLAGKNALIVSHGNALRALEVYVESIPTSEAHDVEMLFGAVVLYAVDGEGKMLSKEVRQVASRVNA